MKYTKRLLISMSFFAFLLTVSGCTNEEEIGGGSKEHPAIQTIRATKSDFITTQEVNVPLTRTTIDGYKTTFSDGDQIGLFAIKDGAIVDNVNNMALTCTVTEDGTTSWTLPADTKIYYYEGVTYIAYYPYNVNVTIDASKTNDKIINSLVDNSYLQPKEDQSATDGSGYTASDLMIATASADASNISKVTLSLKFEHQFSLLVMTPQELCTNITEPTSAGFTYRTKNAYRVDPNAQNIKLSNISPLKMSDGSYCAIMRPDMLKSLSVKYQTENDKFVSYSCAENEISITSGQYYTLAVNSPVKYEESVVRPLKPGDFVFYNTNKDGIEIYPGDGELETNERIPNFGQAVGIVVTCDPNRMTDKECNKKNWNHAYAIGFVTKPSTATPPGHSWGPSEDDDYLDNYTTANGANNMNGYTETDSVLTNFNSNKVHYIFESALRSYIRVNNPIAESLKDVRSDWFIPSVGQYYDLLSNLCGMSPDSFSTKTESSWTETANVKTMYSRLQSHYAKLGRSLLLKGTFWASSEYDANNAWYLHFTNTKIELGIESKSTSNNMYVYAFFAF